MGKKRASIFRGCSFTFALLPSFGRCDKLTRQRRVSHHPTHPHPTLILFLTKQAKRKRNNEATPNAHAGYTMNIRSLSMQSKSYFLGDSSSDLQ